MNMSTHNPSNQSGATPSISPFELVSKVESEIVFGSSIAMKVVNSLKSRLGRTPLTIEFIARDTTMTKRTLQRRLKEQGVTFALIRDKLRLIHALKLLDNRSMSVTDIACALDFGDRTSFANAFKRWTGGSPGTYRKEHYNILRSTRKP